jgi:nucleotide-binding universal stress UspA family protein
MNRATFAIVLEEVAMSYSTLMVHLDLDQSNEARLQFAGELAERFDSRLIGIAAADIQPLYFMDGAAAQDFLEKDRARLKSQIAECEAQFRRVLRARADNIEWRSALEWPADFVARNARAADLLITGSRPGRADGTRQINSGELVLRAGRPVLIVPPGAEFLKLDSVVVAWKDTREARRAVSDALPLLHKAREVIVVELLEADADKAAAKARVDDVAHWLVRREISASSIATKALVGVADRLTILAQDEGAGIIVAGAYGHSRFQEWVFGGVTRELLSQQKCCALLSQ